MSATLDSSKINAYLVAGAAALQLASKAVQYVPLNAPTQTSKVNIYIVIGGLQAAPKALQYLVVTLPTGYELGTLRRARERCFPRGFRQYPRPPWQLEWRHGR